MKDYIKIQDLVIDYGKSLAVDRINIDIEKGSLVTLLGPSGCGKSTTLNALAGLITPTAGKLIFNGKDVTRTSPSNRGIGLVFQSYALYPHMSVYDNIAFSLRSSKDFKKEIEEHNLKVQFKIWEVKWKSLGLDMKVFNSNLNLIKDYRKLTKERNDKLNQINLAYSSSVSRAKELAHNEKLRMDGKIKAASEKMLSKIESWDKEIKSINLESKILIKNNIESKEEIISSKKEKIDKIIESKKQELEKYNSNIKRYKNEYKSILPEVKTKAKQKIENAKKDRAINLKKIETKLTNKINSLKSEYPKSLALIRSKVNKYITEVDKKADLSIDKLMLENKTIATEIDLKVKAVADKVGITQNLQKMVTNLSGGQQQRVAISRTLVKNPDILLLDEPLSNLDAKMRISTREWIRNLQQELGITTVFVTHDQEEAMSISDEIVCMSVGHVQQKAKPMDMYHNPANKFVAGFLGMPMMNFFEKGEIADQLAKITKTDIDKTQFGCRPEHIKLTKNMSSNDKALIKVKGEVLLAEAYGREVLVTLKVNNDVIRFFVETEGPKRGDKLEVAFRKSKVYAFEKGGEEKTIGRY